MSRTGWCLAAGVLVLAGAAGAAEPPYKRLLQGENARKAARLTRWMEELWAAGKFAEAVAPAEEVLALRQRVQGEDHWEAATAAEVLRALRRGASLPADKQASLVEATGLTMKARAEFDRGRYTEAEPLFRKALAGYEEALGAKHSFTASALSRLGGNLGAQGRPKEAERLYRQALAVYEEVLGPRHPNTAKSYGNLASILDTQGRYKEAEPLHRKALAINEEVLGPRHPDTAISRNNVAYNLDLQGRFTEAEPLLRTALAVREEMLGPGHPETAGAYNNLAFNLLSQGRPGQAEALYRQALVICEAALGPKHPQTATSCSNVAGSLQAQGRYREAEPLVRWVVAVREEMLGPGHPDTARGRNNLAVNLGEQGRVREAEALYRKALAGCEEALGPKHPETTGVRANLADNLGRQGRYNEAEALLRKALAVAEEVLGAKHPETARVCTNLAGNLQDQGRFPEAETLFRQALAVWEAKEGLGPKHPDTAKLGRILGDLLDGQGRFREAEPLHRKALAVAREVLGPQHPDTARICTSLAGNVQAQKRFEEAEPLWCAAAEGKEAARLRMAASTLDRAAAIRIDPQLGLAACRARLDRPLEAWQAAEAGLGRGLLDDLAAEAGLARDPERGRRTRERAARLDAIDRVLVPLVVAEKLDESDSRRRDELLRERAGLDREAAEEAAERNRQAVLSLDDVRKRLTADSALVFWIDLAWGDRWGCVVRRSGPPAWVRLPGSGAKGEWTAADDRLAFLLRDDLSRGEPDALRRARLLAAQRLDPLAPHLAGVRHLVVVPVGRMAGVPVEVLTERYRVSYAPSGSVFARLRGKHRPLADPTLLALGDPNFNLPDAGPPPEPPDHGLYLALVLPGGNAARAGLRAGDVLLRCGDAKINTKNDLQLAAGGARVPIAVWREGKILDDLRLAPGKLDAVFSNDPPAVALRKRFEREARADARSRSELAPLPGTRLEVASLAGLLPRDKTTILVGSRASEQELDAAGKLNEFRLLHFATHGTIDLASAPHSALELARDRLPNLAEQARLTAAGKKVCTGQLSAQTIAREWELDADLVVLSACRTGVGRNAGGEGLLGFTQVLLGKGARSVVLSLWKVDDTATALLMRRFYQNLLGKRAGLDKPLPKAEALQEAKAWLRQLRRSEVEGLAGQLAEGVVRAKEIPLAKDPREVEPPALPAGDRPFNHPRYWAAFILIGDPE